MDPLPTPPAAASQAMSEGKLDAAALPFDTLRALMRPAPDKPSETEVLWSLDPRPPLPYYMVV